MKTSDFYYDLPEHCIAQHPVEPRDSSKLMVYDTAKKVTLNKTFANIEEFLQGGDVLVINNTKVLPARIFGNKVNTGGKIEFLLLKRIDLTHWEVILKPGRIAKVGSEFIFGEGLLTATVKSIADEGVRIVEFKWQGVFEDVLTQIGEMPLPPYIHEKLADKSRYNTVYSAVDGSAAAPTAGLHFTNDLLRHLRDKDVEIAEVLLHVGLGTFRPVKVDDVSKHKMHSEYFSVTADVAEKINNARKCGKRVVAVGTTTLRTLESVVDDNGIVHEGSGYTDIFLYPPYKIKSVDALITNFHLPESTLIMLVSCMCSREEILALYEQAVKSDYRFFSFGDAMYIGANII
ncbi:MAG: tRNA preQ1(34) S-adenosylmethionine ribosyltransferase-isomerase QueA [Corallococcus sp.]|nr:tRNA preQ1(34) S-adenosylmethionine ribosyltransferase-isomerase QueA [Corallococcus sp.]